MNTALRTAMTLALGLLGTAAALSTALSDEGPSDATFAAVVPDYTLQFPHDYGSHPQFRTEWWYLTGWLTTARHETLGFPDHLLPDTQCTRAGQPDARSRRASY